MAQRLEISRAALKVICLKEGNPGRKTLPKLAQVLGRSQKELCQLMVENKLKASLKKDLELLNISLDLMNSYVKLVEKKLETLSKNQRLEPYDLYEYALKVAMNVPLKK